MAGHSHPKNGVASARLCPGHHLLWARCGWARCCLDARRRTLEGQTGKRRAV